jgi:hypothetical protein
MPRIDLDILNQKQTPAFYASSLATRPAASFVGRIFIDSDNPSTGLYRDTGTAWVQIADPGAGTTGTLQQVTTNGSSTTVGISTSGNGIGIGTTIPGSNRLDIHSASGINATFNGTGTTNAALQLQLAGVGKWNLSNFYNAAANDFIITDVLNTTNRLTIKNTGQTFIGTDTTSSGLFVVNSSTSDNHYVAIGSNAPSYRLRDVGSGGALNCGIGISTATNNFIQGSANGNFCFFNSSSTASPILFGIYDAGTGNTQEAVRISAARNFLIGTTTDSGQKFICNGNSLFTGFSLFNRGTLAFTLNPSYATANVYTQLQSTGALALATNGDFNRVYIDTSGNLGLGVTPSAWSSNWKAFEFAAAAIAWTGSGPNDFSFSTNSFFDATDSRWEYKNTGDAAARYSITAFTSEHRWYNAPVGTAGAAITFTQAMTLKSSGILNVTNTPIYATNALALAGGLVAGDIYKSATGVLSIVF